MRIMKMIQFAMNLNMLSFNEISKMENIISRRWDGESIDEKELLWFKNRVNEIALIYDKFQVDKLGSRKNT